MAQLHKVQHQFQGDVVEILPVSRRQRLEEMGLATFTNGSITYVRPDYTDDINDPEEQVRADLYLDLVEQYGYTADDAVVMEKYHKIGHPHKKSDAKIDILVQYPTRAPFLVIELKSPSDYEIYMEKSIQTQLFNVAAVENQEHKTIKYLVYYTRFWDSARLREKTICIDYVKYPSFEEWNEAGRPNLRSIPKQYGLARAPKYVKNGEYGLRTDVRRDELQRIRRDLHNILWGGGKYQNELFFNLVGLFLVKIYDEKETVEREPYQFQIFFDNGEPETPESVYSRINTMYFSAMQEYLGYTDEQLRRIKDIAFDAQKVRYVVEVLQDISFTVNEFDVIGDFFEGIVRGEFKQSKGQYLTHTNLIRFMVEGLQLGQLAVQLVNNEKRLPYIIDPSCGSGAFLIESMKRITDYVLSHQSRIRRSLAVTEFVQASFPEYRHNAWARHFIYGIEINGDLAAATKVNMVGHGDGSANIEAKDALVPFEGFTLGFLQVSKPSPVYPKPVNEQFDAILSNPPFSVTVDRDTAKTFPETYIQGESIAERLQRNNELEVATELLFIERYYQLLRPLGRLAVVLPESVFDTTSTRDVRLFLLKYFRIFGIVALPTEAFAPYTTTKTCILFAEKKTEGQVRKWDEAWKVQGQQYDELKLRITAYLTSPSLAKRIAEIVGRYEEEIGLAVEENVISEIVDTILHYAQVHKDQDSGKLLEDVENLLVAYFEDATDDQKERLRKIIKRRLSFAPALEEYVQLVKSRVQFVSLLEQLLGDFFDPSHSDLTVEQLVEEYGEEMRYADKDWWVFKQVASELGDYGTFLAIADEVGYKRGVRGEEDRPNDLFRMTDKTILVDPKEPMSILDKLLSSIKWNTAAGV